MMPHALRVRQWVDLLGRPSEEVILSGAAQIADAVEYYLKSIPGSNPALASSEALAIATDIT